MGTDESTHVLNDAEDRDLGFTAEGQFPPYIRQGHSLGGGGEQERQLPCILNTSPLDSCCHGCNKMSTDYRLDQLASTDHCPLAVYPPVV